MSETTNTPENVPSENKVFSQEEIDNHKIKAYKPMSDEIQKDIADEVVKGLDVYLDEVSKEWGYSDYNRCCVINADNDDDCIKLEATERWYKHQLEEKDKALEYARKGLELLSKTANATINEQRKEIEKLREQENKFYEDQLAKHKETISKLTQENEALKNK